jgi:hypothetical protein
MWHAIDSPWYLIDKREKAPTTDEDLGMSWRRILGTFETEEEARERLHDELAEIAKYNYIKQAGESAMFLLAASAIKCGASGVRLHGRYYYVEEK